LLPKTCAKTAGPRGAARLSARVTHDDAVLEVRLIIAQPVKLSTVSRGARIIPRAAPSRDWYTQVSDVIVLGGAASTYYCTRPRVRINSFLGDDAAEVKL